MLITLFSWYLVFLQNALVSLLVGGKSKKTESSNISSKDHHSDTEGKSQLTMSCPFSGSHGNVNTAQQGAQQSMRQGAEQVSGDTDTQCAQLWNYLEMFGNSNARITKDSTLEWPTFTSVSKGVMAADYNEVLTNTKDVKPSAEGKLLCANGFVCKFQINWSSNHPYTGLFKKSTHGILRVSSALGPVGSALPSFFGAISGSLYASSIFPCVAMKVFRADTHSGNLLFGGKKTGQSQDLFFKHCLSTTMTETASMAVNWAMAIFRKYSAYPTALGLSDFAAFTEEGEKEEDPRFPWMVTLKGREELRGLRFVDCCEIKAGTVLFDVYVMPDPALVFAQPNAGIQKIGEIVSTSDMMPSLKNDGLFFKHQLKEEDYALRPEWQAALTEAHKEVGPKTFEDKINRGLYDDLM